MAKVITRAYITITNVNDGEKGDTGDTALTLTVTPNTFAFQTNDKGDIENLAQNKGKVRMYLGKVEVVPDNIDLAPYNCYARIVGDNTLYFDGVSPNQWSGKVEITAKYKGQTRTATVEFVVSAQKWSKAQFEANDKQFKSIIAQNKADKQGLEQKISTIQQTANSIQLEVKKQTFGGVNLLKGASLRALNLLSLQRPQYVTIVNYPSIAHLDNPYLSISRHGATQDEWNGCKFPVIKAIGGHTYTLSMFTRIYGSDQPYIEVKKSRSKDMSAPKNSYSNIPSTFGVWKQYTYTFDMEEGYNYLQIFIGLTRNGEAYLSEMQLEEGTKATTWKDPDVVESIQKAGIDIDLQRIIVTTDNFYIKNSEGQVTTAVDKDGNLIAGTIQTKDTGNGHIIMRNNTQEFYKPGATYPSRVIGYIGNDWVDRRLDEDGSVIWELSENGIVHYRRPARWEKLYERYLDTVPNLGTFFNKNSWRTISLIFGEKSGTLAHYTVGTLRVMQEVLSHLQAA
ncbi:hypothetical protein [Prevotella intermedia]|uniref:hypothetical protein n=1 Tax=Prevotella intermedia TaxID=28131 RepID=UPI0020A3F009|nr:hypothetical protein [Prevotella intermedia]